MVVDIKQHKSQVKNSNFAITHSAKNIKGYRIYEGQILGFPTEIAGRP